MTITFNEVENIVLPASLGEKLKIDPKQEFEVVVQAGNKILLRPTRPHAGDGFVEWLFSCPSSFEIPPREKEDSAPLEL
jgi:bifunctional DNA-binding transcriptional regulator/antitoxin component of YhaV-PrlF toxin-antitoxin module